MLKPFPRYSALPQTVRVRLVREREACFRGKVMQQLEISHCERRRLGFICFRTGLDRGSWPCRVMPQSLAIGALSSGSQKRRSGAVKGFGREIANDGMLGAIRTCRSSLITLLATVSRPPGHPRVSNTVGADLDNEGSFRRRGEAADFDSTSLALRTPSPGFGMALARYHGCLVATANPGLNEET